MRDRGQRLRNEKEALGGLAIEIELPGRPVA